MGLKGFVGLVHAKQIAHFTVTDGNEAGVDLVLIQSCLLYYVNHVFVILNSIFLAKKRKEVSTKTRSPSASRSRKGKDIKPTTVKWPIDRQMDDSSGHVFMYPE